MIFIKVWREALLFLIFVALQSYSFSPSVRTSRPAQASNRRYSGRPLLAKNLSASNQERRDEEQRRLKRKEDVIIGKTSAVRDAKDFALNTKATEEEWMRQATRVDQQVFKLTEKGMESLKMLNLEDANEAFDEVFEIKPKAYLWQAGIVKFYLDDLETAANLFAKNAAVYETKFGGRASEERIWRHACELKMANSRNKKKGKIAKEDLDEIREHLSPLPDLEEDPDSLFAETRKVVRIATKLFESSVDNDAGGVILSRAKLRSIGGNFDDKPRMDLKKWKLNAWYYLGLHYDALGEELESKECMKMAFRNSPQAGNGESIEHVLPLIHMCQREWFDDDDMDVDPLQLLRLSPPEETSDSLSVRNEKSAKKFVDADPLVSDSIRKSIAKMNLPELQHALLVRGLKSGGYKKELQDRLYYSLMSDVGLAP